MIGIAIRLQTMSNFVRGAVVSTVLYLITESSDSLITEGGDFLIAEQASG